MPFLPFSRTRNNVINNVSIGPPRLERAVVKDKKIKKGSDYLDLQFMYIWTIFKQVLESKF